MKEIRELEFYTIEIEDGYIKDGYSFLLQSEINGIEELHTYPSTYKWIFKLYPFHYNKIPHVNSDAEPSGFCYKSTKFKYYFAVYKPSLYK